MSLFWLLAQQILASGAADIVLGLIALGIISSIGAFAIWAAKKLPALVESDRERSEELSRLRSSCAGLEAFIRAEVSRVEREARERSEQNASRLLEEIRDTNHEVANVSAVALLVKAKTEGLERRMDARDGRG